MRTQAAATTKPENPRRDHPSTCARPARGRRDRCGLRARRWTYARAILGRGREGEVAEELLAGFTAERPDIHVEVQKLPFSSAHEKLLTAFAGDTLPDLCHLGNTWVPEFHALGALEPLDGLIARSRDVQLDDYFEGFLNSNRIDGVLVGVPWYVDTRLLYYRRDILKDAGFDSPPTTWAEWTEQLAAIKRLVGPDRYSILLPVNEFEPLVVLSLQQPESLLRDDGSLGKLSQRGISKRAYVL